MLGVVAGGEAYTGAAVLCVTAAVESGAGMVRYVGTPTPVGLVRAAVPEAVMGDGRVQAWVVGPGLDPERPATRPQAQLASPGRPSRATCRSSSTPGGLDLVDGPARRRRLCSRRTPASSPGC